MLPQRESAQQPSRMLTFSTRDFGRCEADIVCTFFYELSPFLCGDEILDGLVQMAKESSESDYDFSTMKPCDIEFVKCTGKTCRVPRTVADFEWSPDAVKCLAGQGDLYVRLCRDFSIPPVASEVEMRGRSPPVEASPMQLEAEETTLPPTSNITISSPSVHDAPARSPVDLTQNDEPISVPSSDEVPLVFIKQTEILPRERLYEIFHNIMSKSVFCNSDTMHAFKVLINGPQAEDLLRLKRRSYFETKFTKKNCIDDEDDLLEEALVYYKHPSFDPNIPVRIAFKQQPAIALFVYDTEVFN